MNVHRRLAHALLADHPEDAARALERLAVADAAAVLAAAPPDLAAPALRAVAPDAQRGILGQLRPEAAVRLLEHLPPGEAARLVRPLGGEAAEALVAALPERFARAVGTLLRFPEDCAGAFMDPEVLALPEDVPARQALERVRAAADRAYSSLYVVDREGRLVGVLHLRELLGAAPSQTLGELAHTDPLRLPAETSLRALVSHPAWREVHALPVVDRDGRYLGTVRYRTLRRIQEELLAAVRPADSTADALGELFAVGAAGVLEALADVAGSPRRGGRA